MLRKLRLSTRITVIITILMVLGLGCVGAVSYTVASNSIYDLLETNMMSSVEDAAMTFRQRYDNMITEAEMIAEREEIRSMNWLLQKPVLEELVNKRGYLSASVSDVTACS